ncbi:MAG: hypothetical protein AAGA20_22840 [Planctomycetota bacterium]
MSQSELIEAALGAHRERDTRGQVLPHPAWHDLDDAGRREVFEQAKLARRLEAALDPGSLSSTGRAVLARIKGARP